MNKPKTTTKPNSAKSIKPPTIASMAPKVRVVKLTFTNILIMIATALVLFFFVNNALQPTLGQEVTVDEFFQNIKDNRYSRLDIRNDGNAVGYAKNLNLLQLEGVQLSDLPLAEAEKNSDITKEDSFVEKNLTDLVNELKPTTNIQDAFGDFRNFISGEKQLRRIYVLENSVLVDWANTEEKDWLLRNVSEKQFNEKFLSNNLDPDSLGVSVSYLRASGVLVSVDQFKDALSTKRYGKIWVIDQKIYSEVSTANVAQNYVNFGTATADFTKLLQEEGIDLSAQNLVISVQPISQIDIVTIFNFLFIAVLAFLGYMLLRSVNGSNGGLMQFGQSKARMFFGQKLNIKFADVAGVDEAKEELKEVVDFLKNPQKYQKLGAKIPRGILMVGEPGTGKTLMARAIAGEAGVPFFHTSGSEFEEMLVGAGASRVRDLFAKAKSASPALIFIDEIDAVGRKRGTTIQSSSTEQTLNQILVEMDGFEPRDNVIVIAATNRPDVLDPALLRPGRFDRKVVLDKPDIEGRKAILGIHAANKPIGAEVDFFKLAKRTVGFSGADLENMLNEAAIIVAKAGRTEITEKDLEEAATKVQTGPIRKRKRTDEELKMTAYHEAGHALVMKLTPKSDPVHRITILSRGMALGYVMPLPEDDQLQMSKLKMESKIRSLLAGHISEDIYFGDVTTGASNDIEKATNIARRMVTEFGMSKKLGLVNYSDGGQAERVGWSSGTKEYSDETAKIIDEEVRRIIDEAYNDTKRILEANKEIHIKLAEELLEKEVIEGTEFEEFFKKVK